jgi:hypothetical protein
LFARREQFSAMCRQLHPHTITSAPALEVCVGPRYPTTPLLTREDAHSLVRVSYEHANVFEYPEIRRYPSGAFAFETSSRESRFVALDVLGLMEFFEPLTPTRSSAVFRIWDLVPKLYFFLMWYANITKAIHGRFVCSAQATLKGVAGCEFTFSTGDVWDTLPVNSFVDVPASAEFSCERGPECIYDATVDLMRQIVWPFGKAEPLSAERVQDFVSNELKRWGAFKAVSEGWSTLSR